MQQLDNPPPAYRPFLDQARWVSAFIVAVGHALAILSSSAHGPRIFDLIADMRGGAVTIFFILSGYLVGGTVERDFNRFDFGRYAAARFSRIYVVLIPALLLTLLFDGAIWLFDPHNPVYNTVWQGGALGEKSIWSRFSIPALAGTILSLEPILGGPVGSAGSLWSLGFEWIFYFAFPLIYGLGYRVRGRTGAAVAVLASLVVLFAVSKIDAAFWLVWLLGAYANLVERNRWFKGLPWTYWLKGGAAVALGIYVFLGEHLNHQIGLPIAGLAGLIFLGCGDSGEKRLTTRIDARLAHFSYSLYVIHLQVMTVVTALLVRVRLLPIDGLTSPWAIIGLSMSYIALSVALAYVFGQIFESRTQDLSRLLKSRLLQPAAVIDTV